MNKLMINLCAGGMLLAASWQTQADLLTFTTLNAENSSGSFTVGGTTYLISNGNVTHSYVTDGLSRVYSYTVTNVDLDGGGVNNDTLSWDMRHSAFNDGTINVNGNDSSVTLGAAFAVDPIPGVNYGMDDDGDGITDWDSRDSMSWSIENINLTTDQPNWVASFDGFTGAFLTGGTGVDYILGEGSGGLTSLSVPASGNQVFAPQDSLLLTADTNNRGVRSLVGSFTTTQIPEPSAVSLLGLGAIALVMARCRS